MKLTLYSMIALFCLSCYGPNLDFEAFEGSWVRANGPSDVLTKEKWWNKDGELVGYGVTLKGADTLFFERLSIQQESGQYYYVVEGVNQEPTKFRLNEMSDDYFLFENAENEFPKRILYHFVSDSMIASLANADKSIVFRFGSE